MKHFLFHLGAFVKPGPIQAQSLIISNCKVLSIALVGSRTGIEPDDETTDILVLIHAPSSEQGNNLINRMDFNPG